MLMYKWVTYTQFLISPFLHSSFHVGYGPVHVLVGLDGGLLTVPAPEEALQVGHHDQVGQAEQEGPGLGAVPVARGSESGRGFGR